MSGKILLEHFFDFECWSGQESNQPYRLSEVWYSTPCEKVRIIVMQRGGKGVGVTFHDELSNAWTLY